MQNEITNICEWQVKAGNKITSMLASQHITNTFRRRK